MERYFKGSFLFVLSVYLHSVVTDDVILTQLGTWSYGFVCWSKQIWGNCFVFVIVYSGL